MRYSLLMLFLTGWLIGCEPVNESPQPASSPSADPTDNLPEPTEEDLDSVE